MITKEKNILKLSLILITTTILFSCNSSNDNTKEQVADSTNDAINEVQSVNTTKGYELMQQKCFICHMEKPNPELKASMLAPPMLKIKEHYKPIYHNKEEFANAIVNFVTNPSDDKILMPGAARRFKIMPNLGYSSEDVKLIADVLYDIDFGTMPKMNKQTGVLTLNNGEKWELFPEDVVYIEKIITKLDNFQSDNVEDYNKLGLEIFNLAKFVLLNPEYNGETLNQIHYFFGNFEENIHSLEEVKTVEEGRQIVEKLKKKFSKFNKYFK